MRRIAGASIILTLVSFVALQTAGFGFGAGGGGNRDNNLTIFDLSPGCNTGGPILPGISNPAGYTLATSGNALTPGEKTLIKLVVGDSISANTGQSAYTNGHTTKNDMLNLYTGTNYRFQDPMLSSSTGPGSYHGRTADKLITNGKFSRVITINAAIAGNCSTDYAASGSFNHRARIGCLYARQLGWPVSGSGDSGNWRFAILYALGTNDNGVGTSAANFTIAANSFINSMRGYGCNGDIFITKMTLLAGSVNAALQAAQAALVDNPNGIYLGPDADSLTGANRFDGTHFGDVGGDAFGTLESNIYIAHY